MRERTRGIEAYFLGPKAENIDFLKNMISMGIDSHGWARKSYVLEDHRHITKEMKQDPSFLQAQDAL